MLNLSLAHTKLPEWEFSPHNSASQLSWIHVAVQHIPSTRKRKSIKQNIKVESSYKWTQLKWIIEDQWISKKNQEPVQ